MNEATTQASKTEDLAQQGGDDRPHPPPLVPSWWKPGDPIEADEGEPKGDNMEWKDFVSRLGAVSSGPEWDRQALKATAEKDKAACQLGAELDTGTHASIMPLFNHEAINGLEGESDSSESEGEEEQETKTRKTEQKNELLAMAASEEYTRLPYPIIIDSGAAESVLPRDWCPQAALVGGPMKGKKYSAANGSDIKNEGQRVVSMVTKQGQWRNMTFQVCNVTRPLASVSKIVEAGHSVVSNPVEDPRGSYIQNLQSGEKMWLTAKDGVYVMETKVAPSKWQTSPSFARQER